MKVLNTVLGTALGVATLSAWGCDVFVGGRPRQRTVYVEQQPQYVIVREAPPPMRIERRPAPISTAHIWIDGYWNWDREHYVWVGGRYEVPPQRDVVWVAPRYDRDAQGYRYTAGQWSRPPGENPGRGRGAGGR